MSAAATSHYCVPLTYMYRQGLTGFDVWHGFKDKIFSFDNTFERNVLILCQIEYSKKSCSCCASIQTPVSLTFIHGPVIFALYVSSSSDFLLKCRYRGHIHNSGPLPGNLLAARMADLTPDLQVSLS